MILGLLKRKVRLPVWAIILLVLVPTIAAFGFGHWLGAAVPAGVIAGLMSALGAAAKRRRRREQAANEEHRDTARLEEEDFSAEQSRNADEARRETDGARHDVDAATDDAADELARIRGHD